MSEKYKSFDAEASYYITFTLVEWLPLFAETIFASIIVNSLKHCASLKGLTIFGYCIMPSHVHLIVQSQIRPLGSTIRYLKKYTASQMIHIVNSNDIYSGHLKVFQAEADKIKRNKNTKVWQDGFHPEIIFSNKFFFQKLNYIHNNPVVAGLVSLPEEYYYSSARNYAGLNAPLEIIFESQQLIRF
jgi:REP element-mobilizing transposase RayT